MIIKFILNRLAVAAGIGFGLGRSPIMPGTVGSLWGLVLVWAFTVLELSVCAQVVICALLTLLSIPCAAIAEKDLHLGLDPGCIVCDEYMTFPICMIGLTPYWQEHVWLLPFAFVVTRVLDITKPFPAYRSQKLPGGYGITMDDLIVSCYSLGINWLAYLYLTPFLDKLFS